MFVYHDTTCPSAAVRAPAASHAPQPGDFLVDGWLVQPTLNLLSRGGVTLRLRAQLIDLLACFARRPGHVFRREELFAEVWGGRWVAVSGLSRCIAELRAAMGDPADHPRVIETIVKRGYRLIAPVETMASPFSLVGWRHDR